MIFTYNEDFSQSNNLAAKMPDKLKEMQELFLSEATKYNVLPLDNSIMPRVLAPKPSYIAGRRLFVYSGEMSGVATSNSPNILAKSYTITAEIEVPKGGGNGMIVTEGGKFGGYGFYLVKGKPVFTYNFLNVQRFRWEGTSTLTPGKHTLVFDFKYDGPGLAKGGFGVLKVDGKDVASKKIPHTIPVIMTFDETFDVGVDTRTGVDDKDYKVPFRFNGKINKLTFDLGPSQMASEDQRTVQRTLVNANN